MPFPAALRSSGAGGRKPETACRKAGPKGPVQDVPGTTRPLRGRSLGPCQARMTRLHSVASLYPLPHLQNLPYRSQQIGHCKRLPEKPHPGLLEAFPFPPFVRVSGHQNRCQIGMRLPGL